MPRFVWLVTFLSLLVSLFTACLAEVCPWQFDGCLRTPRRDVHGYSSVNCKVIYKRRCDCVGLRRFTSPLCANKMAMLIRKASLLSHLMCDTMCQTRPTWCPWQPWRDEVHQCGTQIRRREKCCHLDIKGRGPLPNRCDPQADPRKRVQVRTRPCDRSPGLLGPGSTSAVYFHIIVTAGGCCLLALLLITIYLKRHQLCSRPRAEPSPTELRGLSPPGPEPYPQHRCLEPPRYEEALRASHCYTPPPSYDVVMAAMLQAKRGSEAARLPI